MMIKPRCVKNALGVGGAAPDVRQLSVLIGVGGDFSVMVVNLSLLVVHLKVLEVTLSVLVVKLSLLGRLSMLVVKLSVLVNLPVVVSVMLSCIRKVRQDIPKKKDFVVTVSLPLDLVMAEH
ncbi:hypothetical protein INT47_011656 [Mucor saturninus]|uniref:Uncharacterized protein n=1 Tax=Mucor saturninus TaxID=64648 RepID=A0A8H7QHG0_9FUNG|nr:hypothetical protein INT47_011656 [Mucor saturninus]